MNELSYIMSLTEALSSFANTSETKSKKQFTKKMFRLLVDGRHLDSPLPLSQGSIKSYMTSLKLLFEQNEFRTLEQYAFQFLKDDSPELMLAYEMVLVSVDPNDLSEEKLEDFTQPLEYQSELKQKMILPFLFGDDNNRGLKDHYDLLTKVGFNILKHLSEELRVRLLINLSNSFRLRALYLNPKLAQLLIDLKPLLLEEIRSKPNGNRYKKLRNVLIGMPEELN